MAVFTRFPLLQWVPTLRFELKFLVVAGDKHLSETLVGDVSDELHIIDFLYLLVVANGDGEQQLVVLAAIQGAGGDVHVQFLGHHRRLVVDGDLLLEDAAAYMALLADVHEFGGESVADVHHGGRTDAGLAQALDDVAAGLGLQLALEEVFLAGEVRRS